jgi:hypothetical protein
MISNISADVDIVFQEYPTVLTKQIIEQFTITPTPFNTDTAKPTVEPIQEYNKKGFGLNINIESVLMLIIVPLLFLTFIILKRDIIFEYKKVNISGIILFIFNITIFIITLLSINKINNGYNCRVNEENKDKEIKATLTVDNLKLDENILKKLNLNPQSIICSNNINNNNFNNIESANSYYGFIVFSIILQIVQLLFLSYFSYNQKLKETKLTIYLGVFYVFLFFNVIALFISLIVNMIGNKIAFTCDTALTTFNNLIYNNSTLSNIDNNKLTKEELNKLNISIKNLKISNIYNFLICNSNEKIKPFSYKNLTKSFSGFLLVVLTITLLMFLFITIFLFALNLKTTLGMIFQYFILCLSIALISGMTTFILAIDMKYIKSTILSVFVALLLSLVPILIKIFLYIRDLVSD